MTKPKIKTHTVPALPSFASMAACKGATGIPAAVLKHAKRSGCPAFDQAGRVHLGPLLKWIFAEDNADTSTDWHARWKRAQAIGLEQKVARERGDLIDGKRWVEYVHAAAGALRGEFFVLVDNVPPDIAAAAGDIAACREVFRKVMFGKVWETIRTKIGVAAAQLNADQELAVDSIFNPKTPTHEKQKETSE